MPIADCVEATGRAMGDTVFRFISRGSLIPLTILLTITSVILTGILADQTGSQMKEMEINTFVSCKVRIITSMIEPVAQNLTDEFSVVPCFYNKKHPGEVVLGAAPEVDPAAVAACVLMWFLVAMFTMTLGYGHD